jgi:hypothetical protein
MGGENRYKLRMIELDSDILFKFESIGREKIPKIIEYSLITRPDEFDIFNLGFGTYDIIDGKLRYEEVSNNGDVFKVFNTVLSSISLFFTLEPDALLAICGSDSGEDFVRECRKTCIKRCDNICQNENRRINIYRKYIERNYEFLTGTYTFFGDMSSLSDHLSYQPFQIGKPYRSLFIKRR